MQQSIPKGGNISWFVEKIYEKFRSIPLRFNYAVRQFPARLIRVKRLFKDATFYFENNAYERIGIIRDVLVFVKWNIKLFFLLQDLFGVPELLETINDFLKFNTRILKDWEIQILKSVFGDSINYGLVRIDESSFIGPMQYKFAYVSFHTINSWGTLDNATLVHELVHIWQYERMGSLYIPKALKAQYSEEGYDYGGIDRLQQKSSKSLSDFNLEQQAEIVADYYRISNATASKWGVASINDSVYFQKFIKEFKG